MQQVSSAVPRTTGIQFVPVHRHRHNLQRTPSTSIMNRVILTLLFIGLAASASVENNEQQARKLLTRYYNVYKELVQDKNFPDNMNRNDLLFRLQKADPEARAAVQSQLQQRSEMSPSKALEEGFRSMAEEAGFTEEQLKAIADKMVAEGMFPDLREMNKV